MSKVVLVLLASALLIVEGKPSIHAEIAEAIKNSNWEQFHKLLVQRSLGDEFWPKELTGNVESLTPSDGSHVYGHSVSAYKTWSNVNGQVSEDGKGVEITNRDGDVTRREFTP